MIVCFIKAALDFWKAFQKTVTHYSSKYVTVFLKQTLIETVLLTYVHDNSYLQDPVKKDFLQHPPLVVQASYNSAKLLTIFDCFPSFFSALMSLGLLLHGIYLTIPDTSFQKSNVDKSDWVRFITKEKKCVMKKWVFKLLLTIRKVIMLKKLETNIKKQNLEAFSRVF